MKVLWTKCPLNLRISTDSHPISEYFAAGDITPPPRPWTVAPTDSKGLYQLATSLIQLAEARRAWAQAPSGTLLTYLVYEFAPLSFVTGLYSMSDDFAPGGQHFWQCFVIAVLCHCSAAEHLFLVVFEFFHETNLAVS
ncbi:hypothetical protein ETB97_003257 [Aspergillus alliaceus]|uniref:Uncharacterized protein n=1 Tax=Petromyces alliaceus TaxID=209559 RepID=A0A8H6A212_PETAA|nr:hypothetical protein ETB97_003257 [Aspergillus burnettii]